MATKKDLVEAHAFSRRRLVTAFLSGAPGGREVEPARPGRAVIGGVALAVLLLAGAAILGVLKGRNDVDFSEPGLVSDDRGTLYVILEEDIPGFDDDLRLRQVINVTSAQLILGDGADVQEASAEDLAAQEKGPPIGILGAPSTVPPTAALVNSGWTSCTAGSGIRTDIDPETLVTPADDAPFLVQAGKEQFLIATTTTSAAGPPHAYSYAIPDGSDEIYTALGVRADAVKVPERWLGLFPSGGSLDSDGLDIDGFGKPISADLKGRGYPAGARNGDYFLSNDTPVVFTADGTQELTPFALAVLRATRFPGGALPQEVDVDPTVPLELAGAAASEADWPTDLPTGTQPSPTEEVCAVLHTEEDEPPRVGLAIAPQGDASAAEVEDGSDPRVAPGAGALVRSGDWSKSDGGSVYLIDDRAISYPLRGTLEVTNLGYAEVPAVVVPDVWLKLFEPGVELSQDAALCPPANTKSSSC